MTRPNTVTIAIMAAVIGGSAALLAHAVPGGETTTVDTAFDVSDFGGGRQVEDLPGPDGRVSFREALLAADNTPGPQTIEFAIPQSEWDEPDRATLFLSGVFVLYSDEVFIDFSSQTDFTGDTNPDGNEVMIRGEVGNSGGSPAIAIVGHHNVVKGLDHVRNRGYGIDITGNNNRVIGCTIRGPLYAGVNIRGNFNGPPASGNIVGGTLPGDGNLLASGNAGVRIDAPADDNIVIGNLLGGSVAGVQVRGAPCCDIFPYRNRIGGPTPEERNVIGGSGYTGEHGAANGELVAIEYAFDTVIEGNYIGTEEDGLTADQQIAPVGIEILGSDRTIVRNNLVAGVNGYGISVIGACDDTEIHGNLIGTDRTGVNPLPNWYGINVASFTSRELPGNTYIGGTGAGQGNVIAFNDGAGVRISSLAEHARISGNSIHSNGGLGIDLIPWSGDSGVTFNDPGDIDTQGGNLLQNFPVINEAIITSSGIRIIGTLESTPDEFFAIQFFANTAADDTQYGEGEQYLGETAVVTGPDNIAVFDVTFDNAAIIGPFISATAIDASNNNTSEFARTVEAEEGRGGLAPITDMQLAFGTLMSGEIADLVASDDAHVRLRSQYGFSVVEANLLDLEVSFASPETLPTALNCVIESRMNQPGGTAKVRIWNWQSEAFEQIATYTPAQTDDVETIVGIDPTDRVRDGDGYIVMSLRMSAVATFSPMGFQAFIDQTEVTVD